MIDRVHRELTDADIRKIADTYHAWRGDQVGADGRPPLRYADLPGFCKAATLEDIRKHGHVLTPGRYVGAEATEDDGEPFEDKMAQLVEQMEDQFADSERLEAAIRRNLQELGFGR